MDIYDLNNHFMTLAWLLLSSCVVDCFSRIFYNAAVSMSRSLRIEYSNVSSSQGKITFKIKIKQEKNT